MASNATLAGHDRLIGSDQMRGSPVYADGHKVGEIDHVMIDRTSGKVAYAVLTCGHAGDCYPLPWSLLRQSESRGGYEADITDAELKGAPKYCRNETWDWTSPEQRQMLNDYYNVPPM